MSKHFSKPKMAVLKLISITMEVWANLAIKFGLPSFYFHRPYVSIYHMRIGGDVPEYLDVTK